MSGPSRVPRTVGYVLLAVAGIVLLVVFADRVIDWLLGVSLWILLAPGYFLASLLVAGLAGALVTLPARRGMKGDAWHGLVAKVSLGIWIILSVVVFALGE